MIITRIKIKNYKSFLDTPEIFLLKGINLIVGKNNSGKTSLLEIIEGKTTVNSHLNEERKPRKSSKISNSKFQAGIEIFIDKPELLNLIDDKSYNSKIYFYNDKSNKEYFEFGELFSGDEYEWFNFEEIEGHDGIKTNHPIPIEEKSVLKTFKNLLNNGLNIRIKVLNKESKIANFNNKYVPKSDNISAIEVSKINSNPRVSTISVGADYEVSNLVTKEIFENRIFKFDVHRPIESRMSSGGINKLLPNCSNLPIVLNYLRGDNRKFNEFIGLVKEIFPEISDISLSQNKGVEIRIWMPQSTREDLSIPLHDCGTGLGQVMAMLYLLVSSEESQIIIIDEPNSFLHPSASRKLIDIFNRYTQHQYIITTHSPEIIANSKVNNLLLLSINDKGRTEIQKIDRSSHEDLKKTLSEIGAKLSDVFGYDKILWVEGQTEELCFPKIVEKLVEASMVNVPILRVYDTGSFEKKHIQTSMYIYKRIVGGNALIPPALAFIFDREGRKEKDITDLEREGKQDGQQKIFFLKKRLYENYLLDAEAVVEILKVNDSENQWSPRIDIQKIEQFFKDKKIEKKYWDNKQPTANNLANWKSEIHAAKLLSDTFKHFSENKLIYRKTTHSIELTDWLIENNPSMFKELKELLSNLYKLV